MIKRLVHPYYEMSVNCTENVEVFCVVILGYSDALLHGAKIQVCVVCYCLWGKEGE